jgi:pimeloyl-ACP methyl ester carboxylesterase
LTPPIPISKIPTFEIRQFPPSAHDRRGHGRSSQTSNGNDMDHYADDLAALTEALDLKDAIHVGHSTGGGEVTRYIGRHGSTHKDLINADLLEFIGKAQTSSQTA